MILEIRKKLGKLANKKRAKLLQGFFKTGPGEYGEGDVFLGIQVPVLRKLAKEYREIAPTAAVQLLKSSVHEERLLALFLLVGAYARGDDADKKKVYGIYMKNVPFVNNWDLVDLSAPQIPGDYLVQRSRKPLYTFAKSNNLWKRRIAIIATAAFIRQNDFSDTLRISRMLLYDGHDLIHKAVGWMLREVGKRHLLTEEGFLKKHYRSMPRTMLRYAIERFPEAKRKRYLKGSV
ncbi:MAG TPA: DNA alkylation repair protein [Nitrospiraceae bacterium]|nr:DNA alkylation repair protein [Nitrospiraceae bacterium]